MKKNLLYIIGLLAIMSAGCKKSFLDTGRNPNAVTGKVNPAFVFTNALAQTVSNMVDQNELGFYYAGQWTQSNSYEYNVAIFAYRFSNNSFNFFDPLYDNLEDYQYVINNTDPQKQPFLKGPALVMKAMIFQQLVDLYGNVPYREALQGASNLTPEFDDQKAIYEDLILLLDTAITNLKTYPTFTGTSSGVDIVFHGNVTHWIQFANTLKLRVLLRQSFIQGRDAYIVPHLQKAIAEGMGFLDAGQDVSVNPGYTSSPGKQNPFYEKWGYTANGAVPRFAAFARPTQYLFDVFTATDDTFRLKRVAYANGGENPATPGVSFIPEIVANYTGIPFGAQSGYPAQLSSAIGPHVITKGQNNSPLYLMTSAEAQFLLAEMVQRYGQLGLPKTAQQYYEQGIRESFRLDGNADTLASTLIKSGKEMTDWTASPDKLKAIWMQKWLSFVNILGQEAWTEVRRTKWPPVPISAGVPPSQNPPIRLFYPATELGSNEENVMAQGNIDVFNTRIFWDIE